MIIRETGRTSNGSHEEGFVPVFGIYWKTWVGCRSGQDCGCRRSRLVSNRHHVFIVQSRPCVAIVVADAGKRQGQQGAEANSQPTDAIMRLVGVVVDSGRGGMMVVGWFVVVVFSE